MTIPEEVMEYLKNGKRKIKKVNFFTWNSQFLKYKFFQYS